jgi:hypothetical protein
MMNGHQRRKFGKTLVLILLFVVPAASAQTNSQAFEPTLSNDRAVWEMDMRKYGYKSHVRGKDDHWSVGFAGNDNLVLRWTTPDDHDTDAKNGPLARRPSHLHALVLDARTGRKKNIQEWSTSTLYATIRPVANGSFVVCTGTAIQLFSHDFTLIREQPLSRFGPCAADQVSPSGRSVSIDSGVDRDYERTLMEVESFKPLATWSREALNVDFTDDLLVANCRPNFEVCIRKKNQPWRSFDFPEMAKQLGASKRIKPFFVGDLTLVLAAPRDMAVATLEGTLLFRISLPSKYLFGSHARSGGGERFAMIETKMRGETNEFLDMSAFPSDDHVVVYDVQERKAIYARKVTGTSPWPPWIEHRNRIALSPDGTLLAIFDNGIVGIYEVPALYP